MKKQWRFIFNKNIELNLEKAIKVITKCCIYILHNIFCLESDEFESHMKDARFSDYDDNIKVSNTYRTFLILKHSITKKSRTK